MKTSFSLCVLGCLLLWIFPCAAQDDRPTIQAEDILRLIDSGQAVELDGVTIEGNLDLTLPDNSSREVTAPLRIENAHFNGIFTAISVHFTQVVSFSGTTFILPVTIGGSQFDMQANFSGTGFGRANFNGTHFEADTFFQSATFLEGASFAQTEFAGLAEFSSANLSMARFSMAKFKNSSNFSGCVFDAATSFDATHFSGYANFTGAQFGGEASFGSTVFERDTNFSQVHFEGAANFAHAQFTGIVNFYGATFDTPDSLNLIATHYQMLIVNREFDLSNLHLSGDYQSDTGVLQRLENTFREQNFLELTNAVLYQRAVLNREVRASLVAVIEYLFIDFPFGYFVHLEFIPRVYGFLMLLFTLPYFVLNVFTRLRYRFMYRRLAPLWRLSHAAWVSFDVMTLGVREKLGFSRATVPTTTAYKLIVAIQQMLAVYLFGGLVTTFINVFPWFRGLIH